MGDDNGFYRCYVDMRMSQERLDLIGQANDILAEYTARGYVMTLRGLYYQLVARDVIPNNLRSYDRLGAAISDGRLAGLVSWTAINDQQRYLQGVETTPNVPTALIRAKEGYRRDLWADQRYRPEVWVEKDALSVVIEPICSRLRVDFFACKGYTSQSAQWRAGRRLAGYIKKGQTPIIFHLGDHDPSGIDMTRDNMERLSMFAGTPIIVQRLALNMPQIEELSPPPNPAKVTDSRFEAYQREHGDESWELDALPPDYIEALIEDAVGKVRDEATWQSSLQVEADDRERMAEIADEEG